MDELPARVRAVCDLDVADVREFSGRHEYDGVVQDLSPDGVRAVDVQILEPITTDLLGSTADVTGGYVQ